MTVFVPANIFRWVNIAPADFFTALSHGTRLRCLLLPLAHDELCVGKLTQALGAAQPHVSRHLAQLRHTALVCGRRQGLWIHYRISSDMPDWVKTLLNATAHGTEGVQPYLADLAAVPNHRGAQACA